jgi:hypothetical protein
MPNLSGFHDRAQPGIEFSVIFWAVLMISVIIYQKNWKNKLQNYEIRKSSRFSRSSTARHDTSSQFLRWNYAYSLYWSELTQKNQKTNNFGAMKSNNPFVTPNLSDFHASKVASHVNFNHFLGWEHDYYHYLHSEMQNKIIFLHDLKIQPSIARF